LTETNQPVLTVSEFLDSAKTLLESRFAQVAIRGEITNFKVASSGHMYFSLKDAKGRIDCAFFRGFNQGLAFKPEDGLQVVMGGTAGIYEARGQFQVTVRWMEPQGLGGLQLAFEQLKRKLQAEGLFDESRKRPLPRFPRRVAVLTSGGGAAWQDFLRILESRVGIEEVELYDVRVQGAEAASDITAAFQRIADWPEYDVVVLTRGGGSAEDLAVFNDEAVVRAVAACPIPVLCAVGHEIDHSLCDFAADKRAPTPTAAAEWLAPDKDEMADRLEGISRRLRDALAQVSDKGREDTQALADRLKDFHPLRWLDETRQRVDEASEDIERAFRNSRAMGKERVGRAGAVLARSAPLVRFGMLREKLESGQRTLHQALRHAAKQAESRLSEAKTRLDALHPLAPLERGYALVTRAKDGRVLRSSREVQAGEGVEIRLAKGTLGARVTRVDGAGKPVETTPPLPGLEP